uniref:Uncharacterized protein n=1 Tax=Anguilla anguilla TaxID=7936 RepID=A0A0E9VL68_ANGAN
MNKINFVVFLIPGLQVAGVEMWQNDYDQRWGLYFLRVFHWFQCTRQDR